MPQAWNMRGLSKSKQRNTSWNWWICSRERCLYFTNRQQVI